MLSHVQKIIIIESALRPSLNVHMRCFTIKSTVTVVYIESSYEVKQYNVLLPARRGTLILKQQNTFNIYYQRRLSENCSIGLHYKLLGRYVVSLQTILLCLYQEFPDKTY